MRLAVRSVTLAVVFALVLAALPAAGTAAPAAGSGPVPAAGAAPASTTQEDCSFPVTETDATGTEVTVDAEPERVVVLAPSAAQVLWELDAQEKVVGMPVTRYTAYLEGSESRTNVANQDGSTNVEQVVGTDPDLVLAPNVVPNATVEQLRNAGLTVYKAGFGRSLSDITARVSLFGRFVGACEAATEVNAEFNATVDRIRTAVEGREEPRVLYYFFNFTAGQGTFIDEVIETAGGDNVAANAGVTFYQQVNPEIVADRDPEWVVVPSDAEFPQGEPYASTTAYEQNQTLVVDTNLISQSGPRVVVPMRTMAEAFHPDAFPVATPTPTPTSTPTPTPTTGTEATPTPTEGGTPTPGDTTDAGGPGLGVPVVVLALLAAALVAARRG